MFQNQKYVTQTVFSLFSRFALAFEKIAKRVRFGGKVAAPLPFLPSSSARLRLLEFVCLPGAESQTELG